MLLTIMERIWCLVSKKQCIVYVYDELSNKPLLYININQSEFWITKPKIVKFDNIILLNFKAWVHFKTYSLISIL